MIPVVQNLLATSQNPEQPGAEEVNPLLNAPGLKLEHLVSQGKPSPPRFWYDQPQDEWVLLLRGRATLAFEKGSLDLTAGDCLTIPARLRHRVESVSHDAVWVALHFGTRD